MCEGQCQNTHATESDAQERGPGCSVAGDSPAHPGGIGNRHPYSHKSRPSIDANPVQTQPSDTRETSKVVMVFVLFFPPNKEHKLDHESHFPESAMLKERDNWEPK